MQAVVAFGHEHVPEAALARLGLQLFHHRRREVRIAGLLALAAVDRLGRTHDVVVEVDQLGLERIGAGARCEVHVTSSVVASLGTLLCCP